MENHNNYYRGDYKIAYLCHLNTFFRIVVIIKPQLRLIAEVIRAGSIISVGDLLAYSLRNIATVVDIKCNDAVFITTNLTILSSAVGEWLFSLLRRLIAFSPKGVAALSSPSIFAVMFIEISCLASSSFNFGKSIFKTGESNFASALVRPLFSAIFIKPFHKQTIPKSFIAKEIAMVPLSMIAFDSALIFPLNIAQMNDKAIIKGQI